MGRLRTTALTLALALALVMALQVRIATTLFHDHEFVTWNGRPVGDFNSPTFRYMALIPRLPRLPLAFPPQVTRFAIAWLAYLNTANPPDRLGSKCRDAKHGTRKPTTADGSIRIPIIPHPSSVTRTNAVHSLAVASIRVTACRGVACARSTHQTGCGTKSVFFVTVLAHLRRLSLVESVPEVISTYHGIDFWSLQPHFSGPRLPAQPQPDRQDFVAQNDRPERSHTTKLAAFLGRSLTPMAGTDSVYYMRDSTNAGRKLCLVDPSIQNVAVQLAKFNGDLEAGEASSQLYSGKTSP
ncbi:hypothetical protein CPLU01_04271 [Colletotrichum plurivorum]|uniref:Uncharacterized protein n=1 Tax=Colletotrichum plurivorum TaxID=2175906 RepID=A0A8H6NK58_9PEZI|nr:hypothetical protein CPLU01_04271 [Colletotrichum plurivorum]